ncbi:ANK [Seminavis robusta]|uniref:ANK n=1 Tax=Seminavis robusta TaxID=568900 RepID=A0A9N8DVF6_9STRA|nr:ANK [Seminavis robusta]|eukprot:Sro401_g135320.1 ANK (318) ;mRNA; f:27743-28696
MIPSTSNDTAPLLLQEEELLKYHDTDDDSTTTTSSGSSYYDSDDSSSWDSEEDDEELVNEITQQLSLKNLHLILDTANTGTGTAKSTSSSADNAAAPTLNGSVMQDIQTRMNQMKHGAVYIQSTASATGIAGMAAGSVAPTSTPQGRLEEMLKDIRCPQKSYSKDQWSKHFLPVTQDRVDAYSLELSKQVRAVNLSYLRAPRAYNWDACNRQGESLIHLAARRSNLELVEFLLHKDAVLMVRDDYGKTPLHEACWSKQPNFEIIQWILTKAPALVFCRDARGFAPLDYVPRECYSAWTEFLESQKVSLRLNVQLMAL